MHDMCSMLDTTFILTLSEFFCVLGMDTRMHEESYKDSTPIFRHILLLCEWEFIWQCAMHILVFMHVIDLTEKLI